MLDRLRVATKVTAGFLLVALLALAVGALASRALGEMQRADARLFEETSVPLALLIELSGAQQGGRDALRDAIDQATAADIEARLARVEALRGEAASLVARLAERASSPEGREVVAELERAGAEAVKLLGILRPFVSRRPRARCSGSRRAIWPSGSRCAGATRSARCRARWRRWWSGSRA